MKVYGVFKIEIIMLFSHRTLLALYENQAVADGVAKSLNDTNKDSIEEDSYGPIGGCSYVAAELDVIS